MKYNIVFKNHLLQAAASNSVRKNKQAKITTIGTLPLPLMASDMHKKTMLPPTHFTTMAVNFSVFIQIFLIFIKN